MFEQQKFTVKLCMCSSLLNHCMVRLASALGLFYLPLHDLLSLLRRYRHSFGLQVSHASSNPRKSIVKK